MTTHTTTPAGGDDIRQHELEADHHIAEALALALGQLIAQEIAEQRRRPRDWMDRWSGGNPSQLVSRVR